MAETILGYLKKTKDETLDVSPFNEVDSLILSQFSYLKFGGMVPGIGRADEAVTLWDLVESDLYDTLYDDERYRKNNTALFEGMLASKRFNQIKLHSYVSIIDHDNESQFAAITIEFPNGLCYVAFRGTDENFVGWKEDFNMSLSKPIPGQIMSVDYLADIAGYIPEYFVVGGHSKGGNLAVFSAMYSHESIQDRITDIYNHDGPGFRNELMDDDRYRAIRNKIRMTIPHSSFIGMLLINDDNYRVVESKMPGISGMLQHNPYSWKVKGHDFVIADEVSQASIVKDKSFNEWVMGLDDDQIDLFLNCISEIMIATGVDNLNDLMTDWKEVINRVNTYIKELDEETKKPMMAIIQSLIDLTDANTKSDIHDRVEKIKENVQSFLKKNPEE